ncbi:Coiled-coil-helix-coiled-coil-helix domain-containing protein 7 [Frankliniella fusca]|uniref:Coiled-coil-helix-coiled-coil-helix domain-containing protein 7 n=1 Tax=Frankliniella fusca TaxID=407009 RepID=A0AAE1LSP1_9NEOP|nr:Coiled-coil-helix-coiled-coil-helix domain-containing protein 7 [Frankliniella fusca]
MASKESERRNERKAQTPENYPCLKDAVQKQRRAANLKPFLPEADEREEIMTHFKKTGTLLDTSQRSV